MNNFSKKYFTALTIAGSDSGGCAGIQADLKTFSALGVFGASVITAVTAQNTEEVRGMLVLPAAFVRQQAEAVLDDLWVDALKIGLVPQPETIETVARVIDEYQISTIIADPVMAATSGGRLADSSIRTAYRRFLYPRLSLLTPNLPEAEALTGCLIRDEADMYEAAGILLGQGCAAVLMKGGHLPGTEAVDFLFQRNKQTLVFPSARTDTVNLHGTGCTLSSAIAAFMALGHDLENAVALAKVYVSAAIEHGKDIVTGRGAGPVNHFFNPQALKCKRL